MAAQTWAVEFESDEKQAEAEEKKAGGVSGGYAWAPIMLKLLKQKKKMLSPELVFHGEPGLVADERKKIEDATNYTPEFNAPNEPKFALQIATSNRKGVFSPVFLLPEGLPKRPREGWQGVLLRAQSSALETVQVLWGARKTSLWLCFVYANAMFRNGARLPQGPLEEPKGRDLTRLLSRYLRFLNGDKSATSLLEMIAYRIVLYEETEEGRSEVHKAERDIATFHEKWPALDLNAAIDIKTFREDFDDTHKSDEDSLVQLAVELDDAMRAHAAAKLAAATSPGPPDW